MELNVRNALPLMFTCFLLAWTALFGYFTTYNDRWAIYPAIIVLPITAIAHVMLILKATRRTPFLLYAVLHLAIQAFVWVGCLMVLSKDSL